jgi:hypothetical protein
MFRVEWDLSASDQFAAISVAHPSRWKDIDAADTDIDRKLQRDPVMYSQSVAEGLRRIISEPLVIYFTIQGEQVNVEAVGWIGPAS